MVMAPSKPSTQIPAFFTCRCTATTMETSSLAAGHLTKCDQPPISHSALSTTCLSECVLSKLICMCVCVCWCILGGQWSRRRLQREHGFYWRTGTSHGWCRISGSIQVKQYYHWLLYDGTCSYCTGSSSHTVTDVKWSIRSCWGSPSSYQTWFLLGALSGAIYSLPHPWPHTCTSRFKKA